MIPILAALVTILHAAVVSLSQSPFAVTTRS